ncbi:MAG: hypothetical protein Q8L11_02950 [Candidatus Moranbacteria bacterium]|nr:hypothetical protein [Candidatus Moranbacteria bacterium]
MLNLSRILLSGQAKIAFEEIKSEMAEFSQETGGENLELFARLGEKGELILSIRFNSPLGLRMAELNLPFKHWGYNMEKVP